MKFIHTRFKNPKIVAIIVLSVLLRVGAAIYLGDQVVTLPGTDDQKSYHSLALRVIDGYGFTFGENWWPATAAGEPTAHWSYLYTFYLVVSYAIFGIHPLAARLIQAVIVGFLQPYLVYRIGQRAFGEPVGLIAAALTGVYMYFVYYAGALMTEPFYITAILGVLFLAIQLIEDDVGEKKRWSWVSLGILLGTVVLLRQLFLLFIPFLFLWIWWANYRRNGFFPVSGTILTSGVLVLIIFPVSLFNYLRFERIVLLNTNAGYAFFWGNHPVYGTRFEGILSPEKGDYQSLIPKELLHLDEASLDRELLRRGIGFVVDDPGRYILLSISRIPVYFKFWPSHDSGLLSNIARVGSFGLLWPFMLYGLLYSFAHQFSLRRSDLLAFLASSRFLLILFFIIYSGIHLLSWALIRYRLPVDAVLVIFAGLALLDLISRIFSYSTQARVLN